MECKICLSKSILFSEAEILNNYKIKYFKCINCDFVQTEEPYWLEEAYSEAINRSDIGLISRNILLSKITKAIIVLFFNKKNKFIDYGGGYGIFVRLMRDLGFDFYWNDKFCVNLFAKDFEVPIGNSNKYELLTAFEVFEHLNEPVNEVKEMLKYCDNILFTTYLMPKNNPKPNEWWYYSLDHGQHISLYSRKSLELLAKKFDLNFYTNGRNIHLLTKKTFPNFLFKAISFYPISLMINLIFSKKSLLEIDHKAILNKIKLEKNIK